MIFFLNSVYPHIGLIPGAKNLCNQTTSSSLMSNHLTSNRWLSDHEFTSITPPHSFHLHLLHDLFELSYSIVVRVNTERRLASDHSDSRHCPWELSLGARGSHYQISCFVFSPSSYLSVSLFVFLFVCEKVKCFTRIFPILLILYVCVCVYFVCLFVFLRVRPVWKSPAGTFIVK